MFAIDRNVYILLEALVRAVQFIGPHVPLRTVPQACIAGLTKQLAAIQASVTRRDTDWGLISDRAGNPVAMLAVSELKPCQIEELEDVIRTVINQW